MVRTRRSSLVALLAAMVLVLGLAAPARATTTKQLHVALVTQLTSWSPFPDTETWTGSGVGSDQQLWTFTETLSRNHWFLSGSFSMRAGADGLSGTVVKSPTYLPFLPLTYEIESWSYTVTNGEGAYAGCGGPGTPVRQRVTPPLLPPSGVVVQEITFDLTCP